ncbi:MAG: cytochrome c3 family protein [Pseudomonadota bacterium]
MSRNALLWLIWFIATLSASAAVAALVFVGGDRTSLLIGETTGTHAQFEMACESCHAGNALDTDKKQAKALNKTCVTCHQDELKASNDSHPYKKFRDPRMADYWDLIDARTCTACHAEHKPEITRPGAVTLAMDYCVACHSQGEQDVRVNRASHAGLGFETCASSGCHNFHDNRALYEDFLVKHADEPWLHEVPVHKLEAALRSPRAPAPAAVPTPAMSLAPEGALTVEIVAAYEASAHPGGEVGCASCHAAKAGKEPSAEDVLANWQDQPGTATCESCHKAEAKTFRIGRHGMRRHPKIAKPRDPVRALKAVGIKLDRKGELAALIREYLSDAPYPTVMTVAESPLPMKAEAAHEELTCTSCHGPHRVDLNQARVESCASCHDDGHTRAYFGSPHHKLWQAELAGAAAPGTGVTCATCHLPKEETERGLVTNHNQNDVLRPNEKMIRPVCMDCHGLGFAIDALADPGLVSSNFQGRPETHIESIDWATRRVREKATGANQ